MKKYLLMLFLVFLIFPVDSVFAASSIDSVRESFKNNDLIKYVAEVSSDKPVYARCLGRLDSGSVVTLTGWTTVYLSTSEGKGRFVCEAPFTFQSIECAKLGRKCAVTSVEFQLSDKQSDSNLLATKSVSHPGVAVPLDGSGSEPGDGGGADPGGSDPGGTNPGTDPGTDPGGSDPGGGDPGGDDPDDGSGDSCLCCKAVADMLGELKDSVDSSGYKLDDIEEVLNDLNDAVEQNGYKLDDIKGLMAEVSRKIDGTNERLDQANKHLSNISDQVTPKGNYQIEVPNWKELMNKESVPYVDQMRKVEDNNKYFSDPGEGDPVPAMPPQPDINFPVPIGKGFKRENPITAQPPLSQDLPTTTTPVMTPDSPLERIPMSQEPVRQKDEMNADPVRQRDQIKADPVKDRTHIYERQEVPKK